MFCCYCASDCNISKSSLDCGIMTKCTADAAQISGDRSSLRFQISIPENFVPMQRGQNRSVPNTTVTHLHITMLYGDSVDLLKCSISAHVHELAGMWRPPSTFQLEQRRHVRFWEPLSNFALNEPINSAGFSAAFCECASFAGHRHAVVKCFTRSLLCFASEKR